MHQNAIIMFEYQKAEQAIEYMSKYYIRHLPIVNQDYEITGILTSSDLLRYLHEHSDLDKLNEPVSNIMTIQPYTIEPEAKLLPAIFTMASLNVSSLPVVMDDQVEGIFTIKDIIRLNSIWDLIDDTEISPYDQGLGYKVDIDTCLTSTHSIWQAIDKFVGTGLAQLPIVERKGKIIGIITLLSLLSDINFGKKQDPDYLSITSIGDILYSSPLFVRGPIEIKTARKLLLDHKDECFILSSYKRPKVLISEVNLFKFLINELKSVVPVKYQFDENHFVNWDIFPKSKFL